MKQAEYSKSGHDTAPHLKYIPEHLTISFLQDFHHYELLV